MEMFKMLLPILEPLYAHNSIFVGLITTDFCRRTNACFNITLACALMPILYVITQSNV